MSPDQIKYRVNAPYTFLATSSFALGSTGYQVSPGMEVLFDGTNVEVGGNKFVLPTLRGAVRLGWLVLPEEYDEAMDNPVANPSANIQVRSANDLGQNPMQPVKRSAITTVESDERVVMSRGNRAAAAEQQTQHVRAQRTGGGVARAFGNGAGGVDVGGAEFGHTVPRQLLTSAVQTLKVTPDTVGQAIISAEKVKVQPGQGIDEQTMMARMTPEQREDYIAAKESRKGDVMSRMVGYVPPPATTTNLAVNNQMGRVASATPQRVQTPQRAQIPAPQQARVQTPVAPRAVSAVPNGPRVVHAEGMNFSTSVGGGTEIADMGGTGGRAKESVVTAEGMTFRNTNGPSRGFNVQPTQAAQPSPTPVEDVQPSRIESGGTADVRRQIAKALCPDFPADYSFTDHWKRRIAMIRLNYEERFDVIRAIFAAESDDFKELLIKEFPEAFSPS